MKRPPSSPLRAASRPLSPQLLARPERRDRAVFVERHLDPVTAREPRRARREERAPRHDDLRAAERLRSPYSF
jgi:hypothetical protein